MKYQIGQVLYYTGDMANHDGYFEIVAIRDNQYIKGYDLKEVESERSHGREIKAVFEIGILDTYKRDGTRFFTNEAYQKYRNESLVYLRA